jgi:hypothetical protein
MRGTLNNYVPGFVSYRVRQRAVMRKTGYPSDGPDQARPCHAAKADRLAEAGRTLAL